MNNTILSVPSWVIPGSYAENLRFLENKNAVRGVELLFFIFDNETKAELDREWDEIRRYSKCFIFTAHLPEQLTAAHESLVSRLAPLVRHFIVHPDTNNPVEQAALLAEWTKRYGAVFLIENIIDKNTGCALSPLPEGDQKICIDTGHLLLEEKSPAEYFSRYAKRTGEIHLHGIDREQAAIDGRLADHRRLKKNDTWLRELIPLLKNYGGIINLEVFSWEEAEAGIHILQTVL